MGYQVKGIPPDAIITKMSFLSGAVMGATGATLYLLYTKQQVEQQTKQNHQTQKMRNLLKLATGHSEINLYDGKTVVMAESLTSDSEVTITVTKADEETLLDRVRLPRSLAPVKHFYDNGMHVLVLQEVNSVQ